MTDTTPISESLAFKLHRATVLVDRAADTFLRTRFEISYSLFSVLLVAGSMPEPSQRQIADALAVSRASITQRIAALSQRGLVRVAPDERDGRAARVLLTAEGGALLTAAWGAMEAHDDGIDRGVNLVALERELDRLIANAIAQLHGPDTKEAT
ncbi:MAG: MarR family winged helix-turn-helix transcriptional regulator [Actinobacteria bacterium]|nr:MarR family winged helix-turn-helix transcriptional regulator [Actinomycetota bacterium]